jgi:CCR4-NOT transcriptional complex subunit CAF120
LGDFVKNHKNIITLKTPRATFWFSSCPDTLSFASFASGLWVSAYEKSRLEEVYTAHILRLSYNINEGDWRGPISHLYNGKLDGQVEIRIAGETEWNSVWTVISALSIGKTASAREGSKTTINPRKGPDIKFYPSQKEKKSPLLTIRDVTQAFAVYPEKPALIPHSTVIKIEGLMGDEEMAGAFKSQEGWVHIRPGKELERRGLMEMLKWITGKYTPGVFQTSIDNLFSDT